jgi:hypothetical protein
VGWRPPIHANTLIIVQLEQQACVGDKKKDPNIVCFDIPPAG